MEEQRGEKVRVVLRWIQILDRKEPFFKSRGEFVFNSKVHTPDNGGITVERRMPETGYYSLTDDPVHNRVRLDIPIFEGYVENELAIEMTGYEIDSTSQNDELQPYRRVLTGPPSSWLGNYGPGDEHPDAEELTDWRIWYSIEKVEA